MRAATPDTCLAVRRGKDYRRRPGEEALIECELCGKSGVSSICTPALVGGEIIGSVLVTADEEDISDRAIGRVEETTALAAPVLGNLRNLAVAETRILVKHADTVVVVARAGRSAVGAVRSAATQVEAAGGKVLGVALNCVEPHWQSYADSLYFYQSKSYYSVS